MFMKGTIPWINIFFLALLANSLEYGCWTTTKSSSNLQTIVILVVVILLVVILLIRTIEDE